MKEFLENNMVKLRALEPDDLDLLFSIENKSSLWEISDTQIPLSRDLLRKYLENAHQDIYQAKQLRLVITDKKNKQILGLIDLYDFNPQHQRAGVGILILKPFQGKGFASSTLDLFKDYAFLHLDLNQLYANIPSHNKRSLKLFKKLNFRHIGTQKKWIKINGAYKDVERFQLLNPNHL